MPPTPALDDLRALIREAGRAVMAVYATDFDVRGKDDASPVTAADERAEAIILDGLARLSPGVPVVAEEQAAAGESPEPGARFWLVDPLDGTREFIKRNGEFTVNIALVEDGRPVLGLVHAPALDRLYWGRAGHGAGVVDADGERAIRVRTPPPEGLTVVASRSHSDPATLAAYLGGRPVAQLINAGSSLKLCLVAEGRADLYPRLGRTMEWDIAAGHAVLAAAGGHVRRVDDGRELAYGKPGLDNPHFIASGA